MNTWGARIAGVLGAATLVVGLGAATAEAKSTKSALRDASKACAKAGGEFDTGVFIYSGFSCIGIEKPISKHDLTQVARDCGVITPSHTSVLFVYLAPDDEIFGLDGFLCGAGSFSDFPGDPL